MVATLIFFVAVVPTGALKRHSFTVRFIRSSQDNAGETESLQLNERATNDSLRALSVFDKLQTLFLTGTKVTDAGLVHLKGLTNLSRLGLESTQITDAGLTHLGRLPKLHSLNLYGTNLTDAALVHLVGLKKLQVIYLNNTRITDMGLAELKKALPNCDFPRGHP